MGQKSSCISGTMGWQEPYLPTKVLGDLTEVEYQLNNALPVDQQNINRRLTSLLSLKCGCIDSNPTDPNGGCQHTKRKAFIAKSDSFTYSDIGLSKLLYKEMHCKNVNFNQSKSPKETTDKQQTPLMSQVNNSPKDCSQRSFVDKDATLKNSYNFHLSRNLQSKKMIADNTNLQTPTQQAIVNRQSLLHTRTPVSHLLELYSHSPLRNSNNSALIRNCKDVVILLTNHADNIATDFGIVMQAVNTQDVKCVHQISSKICEEVYSLVQEYCKIGSLKHYASVSWNKVLSSSDQLMNTINSNTTAKDVLSAQISTLGQELHNVMESLVLYELMVIIEEIKEETNCYQALITLEELTKISEFMCCLITKAGGVQATIGILNEREKSFAHVATLRLLFSLCSVDQALCQLKTQNRMQTVLEVLQAGYNKHVVKEGIALVAKLTERNDPTILSQILENGEQLIASLSDIAQTTEDGLLFLLIATAVTNLSLMSMTGKRLIVKYSLPKTLISVCTDKLLAPSIAIKEQLATLLASISTSEYKMEIVDDFAVQAMLSFLQIKPETEAFHEKTMCRRIQGKSAMGISSLCDNKKAINVIVNNNGIHQLLSVCKYEECRFNSPVVLFCTLALQKVSTSCMGRCTTEMQSKELQESFV